MVWYRNTVMHVGLVCMYWTSLVQHVTSLHSATGMQWYSNPDHYPDSEPAGLSLTLNVLNANQKSRTSNFTSCLMPPGIEPPTSCMPGECLTTTLTGCGWRLRSKSQGQCVEYMFIFTRTYTRTNKIFGINYFWRTVDIEYLPMYTLVALICWLNLDRRSEKEKGNINALMQILLVFWEDKMAMPWHIYNVYTCILTN